MKLNLTLQALYFVVMLVLGAVWLWGRSEWQTPVFYVTFFLGFFFVGWMGYLLDVKEDPRK